MAQFGNDRQTILKADMKIRKAEAADAATLTRVAHDAKRYWGYPENWIRHWENDLTISSDYIETNEVFVALSGDEVIGFYALINEGNKAELDHLWVAPGHIGGGVGRELFVHAMRTAASEDITAVEILADPNAEGFYQKMGAFRVGESVSEIDGQPRTLPRLTVNPKTP